MTTSSLDDVLISSITKTPIPEPIKDEADPVVGNVPRGTDEYNLAEPEVEVVHSEPEEVESEPEQKETDDYGNERAKKVYTEDEVNERINQAVRDRLARAERNQPAPAEIKQAAKGFEYNEESPESWQHQLESFVENTVSKMSQKQAQQAHQAREAQAQAQFDDKFLTGMSKFNDYKDVVSHQPITDTMVLAARSMKDPAAFFYAASKRAPQELQRIANISDPYAQIAEIGKLEERMKQARPSTKTPRPVSRTTGDTSTPKREKVEPTIEQLIAQDAAKRLALQNKRRG